MSLHYDAAKLKELLNSFYILTKIRIVVFNDAFEKLAEAPDYDCAFCRLIRSDPQTEKLCRESDRRACLICREQNHLYSYTCHAGLTETVTPIYCGNIIIGYLMFGQVLSEKNSEGYWEEIQRRCAQYRIDLQELRRAYLKKRPVNLEQVVAAAQILEACAGFLWLRRVIQLTQDSIPLKIDEYISENLRADLSVAALCERFKLSRSKLYGICREYYGCGVEQLTRSLRIKKAKELLKATSLSIDEIAAQIGYGDYNYFIKVFKKEAGITPGAFRRGAEKSS